MESKQALVIRLFRDLKTSYPCYTIKFAEMREFDGTLRLASFVERTDDTEPEYNLDLEFVRIPEDEDDVKLADVIHVFDDYENGFPENIVNRYIRDRDRAAEYAKELQTRLMGYVEGDLDALGRLDWTWREVIQRIEKSLEEL